MPIVIIITSIINTMLAKTCEKWAGNGVEDYSSIKYAGIILLNETPT